MSVEDIAVIGAGSYGTCLAMCFGNAGHRVSLYCRNPEQASELQASRVNKTYLPAYRLPDTVTVTNDLHATVRAKAFVVGVTPSHGARDLFSQIGPSIDPDAIVINASKGLEDGSLKTIDAIYRDVLPERIAARATFLSGPTFASEIAAGLPAAIVLAGRDTETTSKAQSALGHLHFRIYTTEDVIGVLVGGALKNVIAIGAGVSDGLGFGSNARVALITRGLAEITRMGVAMGADPLTFAGLSGVGDLVLTCSGDASRNRRVGLALGQGKKMADILAEMRQVAEGVKTAKVAKQLAAKLGVDAPITDCMHAIIHEGVPVREAISQLLGRKVRGERD
ncbi:MAG: NAD(P)-dependent glycerol-3-phosphate dehydrogenase [Deltaproteobacteria bacterium]|nr:NAD(P)-dependent glycerol-3-phosphate dehydrogenase [Deltaproteobacteria bacterium]MCW5808559.1 NAD(P)-dependent glycerol-3-phosphate dehydrogenase [Deltaproteobacteria bacterium]